LIFIYFIIFFLLLDPICGSGIVFNSNTYGKNYLTTHHRSYSYLFQQNDNDDVEDEGLDPIIGKKLKKTNRNVLASLYKQKYSPSKSKKSDKSEILMDKTETRTLPYRPLDKESVEEMENMKDVVAREAKDRLFSSLGVRRNNEKKINVIILNEIHRLLLKKS